MHSAGHTSSHHGCPCRSASSRASTASLSAGKPAAIHQSSRHLRSRPISGPAGTPRLARSAPLTGKRGIGHCSGSRAVRPMPGNRTCRVHGPGEAHRIAESLWTHLIEHNAALVAAQCRARRGRLGQGCSRPYSAFDSRSAWRSRRGILGRFKPQCGEPEHRVRLEPLTGIDLGHARDPPEVMAGRQDARPAIPVFTITRSTGTARQRPAASTSPGECAPRTGGPAPPAEPRKPQARGGPAHLGHSGHGSEKTAGCEEILADAGFRLAHEPHPALHEIAVASRPDRIRCPRHRNTWHSW
jgi:hypothetical protein